MNESTVPSDENAEAKKQVVGLKAKPAVRKGGGKMGRFFKGVVVFVVMCVLLAGASKTVYELWQDYVWRSAPVSVDYMIKSSEYIGTGLGTETLPDILYGYRYWCRNSTNDSCLYQMEII